MVREEVGTGKISRGHRVTIPKKALDALGWKDDDLVMGYYDKDKKEIIYRRLKYEVE